MGMRTANHSVEVWTNAGFAAMELITRFAINWTIVAAATPAWASLVFPNDPTDVALNNLWDAIFYTSRITGEDPIADWKQHNANLTQRVECIIPVEDPALRLELSGILPVAAG